MSGDGQIAPVVDHGDSVEYVDEDAGRCRYESKYGRDNNNIESGIRRQTSDLKRCPSSLDPGMELRGAAQHRRTAFQGW